jgi:hypothetical protein
LAFNFPSVFLALVVGIPFYATALLRVVITYRRGYRIVGRSELVPRPCGKDLLSPQEGLQPSCGSQVGEAPESEEDRAIENSEAWAMQARAQQKEARAGKRSTCADAGNGALEPAAVSISRRRATVEPFRRPGIRWPAILAWERGTAPCVAAHEGEHHA